MTITAGTRLGPYEIVSHIGAGGMGEVYRARDTRLDRSVAIKVLATDFAGNAELRGRFEREAKTISQLNHPHICTLYDVGSEDGTDFLVMELLEGESLADRVAKGPMPVSDVLRYGAQIADALARAHRQGVTHRDLKPGNVMLTKSGAKLLDFGLAKTLAGSAVGADAPTEQHRPLTAEGTILGTFQYMAPEQLAGEEADTRSDIFALGAVLYEMATGSRAFTGKTRTSLIANILSSDPRPISELRPLTPPALERLISRCLAKDADERWQSAADVAEELKWIGQSEGSGITGRAAPARSRFRARIGWLVAAVAMATAAALFVALQTSRNESPPAIYSSLTPARGNGFFFGGPAGGMLTISPDSRYVTWGGEGDDGVWRIWVRNLRTGETHGLKGTENGGYPFWSPDSRQLGFFANRKLKTISAEGGPTVDVCDVNEPRGGSWSSDGTILFAPHWRDPIHRVPATGGTTIAVTKINPSRNETTHRWPVFLPDGKHFLYFAGSHVAETTSGDNAIYLASIEGGEPRLLLRARSNVTYAAGHLLFVREQKLLAQRFNPESFDLDGEPVALADDVRYEKGFFRAVFGASDEMLVYQTGSDETKMQLNWINRKGEMVGSLAAPDLFWDVAFSPDGRTAAVSIGDPADIWLYDLVRGSRNRFTFDPWQDASPIWSPDSKTLLYQSDRAVQVDIFRKSIGSSETLWLGDKDFHEWPLSWSPDGRFVLVVRTAADGKGTDDLWIYPADGSTKPFTYMATPYREMDGRFSPDGKLIAYLSDESGRREVYVARFPEGGQKQLVSTSGGGAPRWRGDGRELYFVAPNGEFFAATIVSAASLDVSAPVSLFRVPIAFAPEPYYDVTADGERFLINQFERVTEEPLTLVTNWRSILKNEK